MTAIGEIFRRDYRVPIEEVIKVDVADEAIVSAEIDEYVVTERIRTELETVVEEYVDCFADRSDRTNVWVSGFFGSGKSSFAKILGYVLENRVVAGRPASERFLERADSARLRALLSRALDPKNQSGAVSALVDLSSAHDVEAEEHLVLPIYRAVLQRFGYARQPALAALEFDLEDRGQLEAFTTTFDTVYGQPWERARATTLAINMASRVLHDLDPATFPAPDSWKGSAPTVDADWFCRRAVELLDRRGHGARRLVMVVDEAGQYVARSIPRMHGLQGLAEAVQKQRGRLFLVITSQEKLDEVVDSLEGRQVELARVKDRFPVRVDLTASDIGEVVGLRVLDKTEAGRRELEEMIAPARQRLAANLRLVSDLGPASGRRSDQFATEDLVRLYPLVPYQVQLLIDSVTQRRSQLRSGTPLGGSNRTLIQHAQQLLANRRVGLADEDLGALVTLDRSYELLVDVIDTGLRHQVDQVAETYGPQSTEAQVMRVVALVRGVRSLPLSAANLAVLLHPAIPAESRRIEVEAAALRLVVGGWLRQVGEAFDLQSPEQKLWDQKRQIELRPADEARERARIVKAALEGHLRVTRGRVFKVGLSIDRIDRERDTDSDVVVELVALGESEIPEELVPATRERDAANRMIWWFRQKAETWEALREVFRSRSMAERHGSASATEPERLMAAEERSRLASFEAQYLQRLAEDLAGGEILFHGAQERPPGGALAEAVRAAVTERLERIYPHLEAFAARIEARTPLEVARTDDLASLPDSLGEGGIGLFKVTPTGAELVVDDGPIRLVVDLVAQRYGYGEAATGLYLERHFGRAPYGAAAEVVQAAAAAALRAGLVELRYQGSWITSPADRRLDAVFRGVAPFRTVEVRPAADRGPDLATRSRLAELLTSYTGERCPVSLDELAGRARTAFESWAQSVARTASFLAGVGLAVPAPLRAAQAVLGALAEGDERLVERLAAGWEDLLAGLDAAKKLAPVIEEDPELLRRARRVADLANQELPSEALEARDRLADLLAAGDLAEHVAQVRSFATQLAAAAAHRLEAERAAAAVQLSALRADLAKAAGSLAPGSLAPGSLAPETVARVIAAGLEGLDPAAAATVEAVSARRARFAEAEIAIRSELDRLATAGRVVVVVAAAVVAGRVPGLIGHPEELEAALEALRARVLELLGEDKVVRLR